MKKQDKEDVREAIDFLEKSERASDPLLKIRYFKEGIELLDCYLEETDISSDLKEKERICNIKTSYTRRLLGQLGSLKNVMISPQNVELWLEYVPLNLPEVKATLKKHPELKEDYDKFIDLWKAELIQAIR